MKIENNKNVFNSAWEQESSQKYLKFWGYDYPYLDKNKNNELNLLPIPEISKVQRHIRGFNRMFRFF